MCFSSAVHCYREASTFLAASSLPVCSLTCSRTALICGGNHARRQGLKHKGEKQTFLRFAYLSLVANLVVFWGFVVSGFEIS
ncbi:MAG: hypothetical protein CBE00_10965 [Planctomycetaceae bacterium TMED240]|nr:hypothetical protein [Rhodopirellula sp.]OUX05285.1 MAG: hypothetical protein CBE00_10965 [Planctomycetaceae bacterium TMED240]